MGTKSRANQTTAAAENIANVTDTVKQWAGDSYQAASERMEQSLDALREVIRKHPRAALASAAISGFLVGMFVARR